MKEADMKSKRNIGETINLSLSFKINLSLSEVNYRVSSFKTEITLEKLGQEPQLKCFQNVEMYGREYLFIDFVWRNVSGMFRGVRVLFIDISVNLEIKDFIQLRIQQKL